MTFREVAEILHAAGWREKMPRRRGGHRQFIHPDKNIKVSATGTGIFARMS